MLKRWIYLEAQISWRFERLVLVVFSEDCLAMPREAPWSVKIRTGSLEDSTMCWIFRKTQTRPAISNLVG